MDEKISTTSVSVVPACPDDVEDIEEVFYKTWLATYPNEEFGITVDDIEDRFKDRQAPKGLAERKARIADPRSGSMLLVAKDAGRVVGVCYVVVHADKNQLQSLYVLPEYQGKGVGRALWHEAQKYLDSAKDTIVQVAIYNTNAIAFYERFGFVDTGKRFSDEMFKMKSGAVIPELEMRKRAEPASP